jgi:hypothetical protein
MSGMIDPPKIVVQTIKITNYLYFLSDLIPHTSVSYVIHCMNEGVSVKILTGILDGELYKEWTTDDWMDAFIKEKVLNFGV